MTGTRKVPPDAFEFYYGLGTGRSYRKVAEHFGVAKQTIIAHATQEKWQGRLQVLDEQLKAASETKALDAVSRMNMKHLAILEKVQAKALKALSKLRIESAIGAIKALESSITQERLVRGEASSRIDVAGIIRAEYEQLMVAGSDDDDWGQPERPANPQDVPQAQAV